MALFTVDGEHALVRQSINQLVKTKYNESNMYIPPKTAKDLVNLCNTSTSIHTPRSQNILKKRKFWWVKKSDLDIFPQSTGKFLDGDKVVEGLEGINSGSPFRIN